MNAGIFCSDHDEVHPPIIKDEGTMAVKAITIGEEQQPMVNHVYPPNYLDYVEPDYTEFSQPKGYEGKYTTGFTPISSFCCK